METLLQIGLSNILVATALAVLAAVVGAVTRRPALAHGLWLLVLLKLVTPPFVHLPILPTVPAASPLESPKTEETIVVTPAELQRLFQESQFAEAASSEPPSLVAQDLPVEPELPSTSEPWSWRRALAILWLAGSAGWFILAAYRVIQFRRLLRLAQPVPLELLADIQGLAQRLGLRYCPEVRFVPGSISPMLWSIGGPPLLFCRGNSGSD